MDELMKQYHYVVLSDIKKVKSPKQIEHCKSLKSLEKRFHKLMLSLPFTKNI